MRSYHQVTFILYYIRSRELQYNLSHVHTSWHRINDEIFCSVLLRLGIIIRFLLSRWFLQNQLRRLHRIDNGQASGPPSSPALLAA